MIKPRTPAPPLDARLVSGAGWSLAEQTPERFTLVVFYRGYHCPQCQKQLSEIDRRLDDLAAVGVNSVVAVSGDTEERARRTVHEWGLERLPVAYGADVDVMRAWGLFLSKAIRDGEPELFNEPGIFLVQPDGMLYAASVQSMPFARPRLDDLINGVQFITDNDYPARGEV